MKLRDKIATTIVVATLICITITVVYLACNRDAVGEYLVQSISTHTTTALWKL